ncbi:MULTISPECIES: host attachment protein [Cupriavidus]|uniref:Host attachment protein n=1 Tax=Cupriavidus oxalaticus TaxID=96344 RepID=A0A4P7L3X1_9BURK|nr:MULTISPECIES: host attachment protein [Cupriavidus]MBF6987868.1 host attachment protein [Cupriavidus sp. IK-TO18]QBY49970.1 host attachment protein [Cupriavidus oxalaticus]TDF65550.1 host attachment protein [Cupriavidus sp. L7L]
MKNIWILVADESVARVFASHADAAPLAVVEEITDAAAHADRADLRRDAYGRRGHAASQGDAGHPGAHQVGPSTVTSSAGEDELHQEAQLFAHRVADFLADARNKQRYEELVLIAAPRFLGLLRKTLPAAVADVVTREIDKDFIHVPNNDLQQRLADEGVVPARRDERVNTGRDR